MTPESMDAVFQALAHSGRRKILDIVKNVPGCSVNDVSAQFGMSRIAVMKHLKILEEAKLLISQKQGRTRQLYFNAVPIQMIYDRWTTEYSAFWASQVTDLKFMVEAKVESAQQTQAKAVESESVRKSRSGKSGSGRKDRVAADAPSASKKAKPSKGQKPPQTQREARGAKTTKKGKPK